MASSKLTVWTMRCTVGLCVPLLMVLLDATAALSSRRTPVMGWSTWSVYGCDITEDKIKEQAVAIDQLGLRTRGYTYIDIDDCWQA